MSKSRWAVVVVAACVALAVCGCKEGEKANNFTHILSTFRGEPLISSQGDPSNPVSAMRTFSLVSTGSPDDPLAEKQMLWLLRSHLEGYGYQCVEEPTSADFVVTVATSNEWTAPLGLDRMGRDVALSDEAGKRGPHHGSETEVQCRLQAAGGGGGAGRRGHHGAGVPAL